MRWIKKSLKFGGNPYRNPPEKISEPFNWDIVWSFVIFSIIIGGAVGFSFLADADLQKRKQIEKYYDKLAAKCKNRGGHWIYRDQYCAPSINIELNK